MTSISASLGRLPCSPQSSPTVCHLEPSTRKVLPDPSVQNPLHHLLDFRTIFTVTSERASQMIPVKFTLYSHTFPASAPFVRNRRHVCLPNGFIKLRNIHYPVYFFSNTVPGHLLVLLSKYLLCKCNFILFKSLSWHQGPAQILLASLN